MHVVSDRGRLARLLNVETSTILLLYSWPFLAESNCGDVSWSGSPTVQNRSQREGTMTVALVHGNP